VIIVGEVISLSYLNVIAHLQKAEYQSLFTNERCLIVYT